MNKKIATKIALGVIAVAAIVFGGAIWLFGWQLAQAPTQNLPEQKACTEEAKLCSDGVTYVGRTGPNCEFAACPASVGANDKIVVNAPIVNAEITSPVMVAGRARGTWFFEGSFPVEVYDGNNKLLGSAAINFVPKSATDTWMTEDFVDFSGSVKFSQSGTTNGFMIFKKDNPSDLPTLEESFRIPIKFSGSAMQNVQSAQPVVAKKMLAMCFNKCGSKGELVPDMLFRHPGETIQKIRACYGEYTNKCPSQDVTKDAQWSTSNESVIEWSRDYVVDGDKIADNVYPNKTLKMNNVGSATAILDYNGASFRTIVNSQQVQ